MRIKLLIDVKRGETELTMGSIFEVVEIVQKDYLIEIPMKQQGKSKRIIILKEEAELIED